MEGSGSGSGSLWLMDLDSGGPKTYRSSGSGSATLVESQHPDQGFRMNNPDFLQPKNYFFFWLIQILKFFDADLGQGQFGSGMEKVGTLNYLYRSGNKYFLPHAKKIHDFCGFSLFSYLCVIFVGILKPFRKQQDPSSSGQWYSSPTIQIYTDWNVQ